jgi:hypothetical protein
VEVEEGDLGAGWMDGRRWEKRRRVGRDGCVLLNPECANFSGFSLRFLGFRRDGSRR